MTTRPSRGASTSPIHLPDGLTDGQTTRLMRVADTCPVRRALEAGFVFDEHVSTPAGVAAAIAA